MMLEEKAVDLGRLIGQSSEYQAVKRTTDALNADTEAVALLREMEELRGKAREMIERGEEPGPDMEQRVDVLLGDIQGRVTYQHAVVAQENFDKIMMRVNDWIMDGIRKGAASPIITLR